MLTPTPASLLPDGQHQPGSACIDSRPFHVQPSAGCQTDRLALCSHPFIYFPTFFLMKSVVEKQKDPIVYAFHKWQRDIWGSCKALWTIWVPAQLLNFAIVPRYLRVPFGAHASTCSISAQVPAYFLMFSLLHWETHSACNAHGPLHTPALTACTPLHQLSRTAEQPAVSNPRCTAPALAGQHGPA